MRALRVGQVPMARETYGTSHYRDGFTHRTGKARHNPTEDGALSARSTSYRRTFATRSRDWGGVIPPRPGSAGSAAAPFATKLIDGVGGTERPQPGLADRERVSGRPVNARKTFPGGRYFNLSYTPRTPVPRQVSA